MFSSLAEIKQAAVEKIIPDKAAFDAATLRQTLLTKPLGSLGKLEEIAIWLASWQQNGCPKLDNVDTIIFAGNHGVAKHGVSLFPAEVTKQMVTNFKNGGAAINQLCALNGTNLKVIELDLDKPTQDFSIAPAMSEAELIEAINIGASAVSDDADLITLGEMGISNTSSASAIAMALFGGEARHWTGKGTGLDVHSIEKKAEIIRKAVGFHEDFRHDPLEILRRLGGRELAAIFGAVLAARKKHIPVLLDGFICCAAVAPLYMLNQSALSVAMAGHLSMEIGHIRLLELIDKPPLLQMDMRLGEGSGAVVALSIVRAAVATHNGMATFDEANVSNIESNKNTEKVNTNRAL